MMIKAPLLIWKNVPSKLSRQNMNSIDWKSFTTPETLCKPPLLKCSQYKNDAIQLKNLLISKLPPFSVTYTVKEKRRQFQNKEVFPLSSVVLILTVL